METTPTTEDRKHARKLIARLVNAARLDCEINYSSDPEDEEIAFGHRLLGSAAAALYHRITGEQPSAAQAAMIAAGLYEDAPEDVSRDEREFLNRF